MNLFTEPKHWICMYQKPDIFQRDWEVAPYSMQSRVYILSTYESSLKAITLPQTGQASLLSIHSYIQPRWKWWLHFIVILGFSLLYSSRHVGQTSSSSSDDAKKYSKPLITSPAGFLRDDSEYCNLDSPSNSDPFHLPPTTLPLSESLLILSGCISSWRWLEPFSRLEMRPSRCTGEHRGSSYGSGLGGERNVSQEESSAICIALMPWAAEEMVRTSPLWNRAVYMFANCALKQLKQMHWLNKEKYGLRWSSNSSVWKQQQTDPMVVVSLR